MSHPLTKECWVRGRVSHARPLHTLARLVGAAVLMAATPYAVFAADDPCAGRHVRSLRGPHAVSQKPLRDLADLQKRLPELEAGIRAMVAQDGTLGAGTADALLAAIRSGDGVSERKLSRTEPMLWMVYQPEKGRIDRIVDPCVKLNKNYDAFEIVIEVPEAEPTAAAAICALTVTRNCEQADPTITLDFTGSSAGARVERAGEPIAGQGSRFSVADNTPCSQDETFVVRAQGPATPAHTARVYRFVMPKVCSNLAYLGEAPRVQLAAGTPAQSCEKSVTAPQCQPWATVAVDPSALEEDNPVAVQARGWSDCTASLTANCSGVSKPIEMGPDGSATWTPLYSCCGEPGWDIRLVTTNAAGQTGLTSANLMVEPHDWVMRTSLVYFTPMDGDQKADAILPDGKLGRESFEVEDGLGVSLAFEKRFKDSPWGLEMAAIFGVTDTTYKLAVDGLRGDAGHSANFYAFTVGPNYHFLKCKAADLYGGPFIGYGGLADPNYWVNGYHFRAELDGDFIWGAQLGIDVPFSLESNWGFHGGLRYYELSQKTDAGKFDVDPLLIEAGVSYRF